MLFRSEDASPHFWTSGANVSYTQKITGTWGFAADLQWTTGEQNGVRYSRWLGFAGVALCQHTGRRLYFAPRLMAGFSYIEGATDFAIAVGVDLGRRVTNGMDVVARVDYIPTFGAQIQHNIRLGAGLKWRF